jgi:hypothetical protein
MNRKPPSSAKAVVDKLWKGIAKEDKQWDKYDKLCSAALEKGTPQGDKEAEKYYNKCAEIEAKRSALHNEIRGLFDKENNRTDKLLQNKALPLPEQNAGKTRRKQRGKGWLGEKVGDVCEGLGCPTRARQEQRKKEAEERVKRFIDTGKWTDAEAPVQPVPAPAPAPVPRASTYWNTRRFRGALPWGTPKSVYKPWSPTVPGIPEGGKRRFSRKSNGQARRSRKTSPPSTVRKFRQS